jgi:hypothetical protein
VNSTRRISLAAGILFLITFITAIAALGLFQPVLDDPGGYIADAGSDNRIIFGAFLELLLIIANIATMPTRVSSPRPLDFCRQGRIVGSRTGRGSSR